MTDKPRPRRGRGEGNLEQLPSGKFRAVLSAGIDPVTKKRVKLQETFDRKKDALTWLRGKLDEQARGRLATAGKTTVGEWLDTFLARKKETREGGTHGFYRDIADSLIRPVLGPVLLAKLHKRDVERWQAQLTKDGKSADRRRKAALVLRIALNEAIRDDLIATNPATKVEKPKAEHKEQQVFDTDQAKRFIAATAGYRMAAYYVLALDSGMRPSELLGLNWGDIDRTAGVVSVKRALEFTKGEFKLKPPKSKAGLRRILVTPKTVEVLREHRSRMAEEGQNVESGLVFPTRTGGFQSQPTMYRRSFLPILKKAKLPQVRPYTLRHTSATLLLARGVSILVVSRRLGHERIETTLKHYGHALPEMESMAVDAMREILS